MDQDLHASVMEIAKGLDISMNEFINAVLADFVALGDDMFIVRLNVKRDLDGNIIAYEFRGPKELDALQDSKRMVD
jgi:hypothetical protein